MGATSIWDKPIDKSCLPPQDYINIYARKAWKHDEQRLSGLKGHNYVVYKELTLDKKMQHMDCWRNLIIEEILQQIYF